MRKLRVFDTISLDGYFTDGTNDLGWAHAADDEWKAWVQGNARGSGDFLFGRVTYDMMASFWPTPLASQLNPVVAERMNAARKYVASRTMDRAAWSHTRVLGGDLVEATRALKAEEGADVLIMGSGSIVAQLTEARLIDAYQIVTVPIVLGRGRTLFEGVTQRRKLALTQTRAFSNGNVVSWYEPAD